MVQDWFVPKEVNFTFRDTNGIKIPKSCREEAYQLSIDIVVQTITAEKYASTYTYPDKVHYGFVTLVMQDCATLEIPIHQPRQRIYEARVVEAYEAWIALRQWNEGDCRWFKELYRIAEGGTVEEYPLYSPRELEWTELPIREVYYKPVPHSQWQISVQWTAPRFFTDCTGILRNGKSHMPDGDHDGGLPPGGTQPRQNDPNDPFAGNEPANGATGTEFDNPKASDNSLNNVNPANGAILDFTFKYSLIWCPYPIDPSNPVAACAPYAPAGEQVREATGRIYEVVPDEPNPLCPQCPSYKVLVDGNVVVRSAFAINSITYIPHV
jgi:hypothetical protein